MSSFVNNLFYNTFKTTMGCSSSSLCFCTVQEDALIIRIEALACIVIMSLLKTTVFAMHFCRYEGSFENAVLPLSLTKSFHDLMQYGQF